MKKPWKKQSSKKMFEKTAQLEKEAGLEQMAKVAGRAMEQEAERAMEPRRLGGYLLNTKMALALALGMVAFGGKAEGQVLTGRSYHPKGPVRQTVEQVVRGVMFETNVAINNSQGKREMKAMDEYAKADSELASQEMAIDSHYGMERFQANKRGDTARLRQLEQEHHQKKMKIARARAGLRREYSARQGGIRATTGIVGTVFGEAGRR